MKVENLAWKTHILLLEEEWRNGELTNEEFCQEIYSNASPAIASSILSVIKEDASKLFDWWFTMKKGNKIQSRKFIIGMGSEEYEYRQRIDEAFHRAILERREPL